MEGSRRKPNGGEGRGYILGPLRSPPGPAGLWFAPAPAAAAGWSRLSVCLSVCWVVEGYIHPWSAEPAGVSFASLQSDSLRIFLLLLLHQLYNFPDFALGSLGGGGAG